MLLFEAQSCRFPFFDGWKPTSRATPPAWWSGGGPELDSGAVTSIPQTPTKGNWCVQCDSTTDAEGWIYGSSWSALGWRGNGATGGWLAAPAPRNFGRYSCCASDTVRRRRWVFFPGPQVRVGHYVVAKHAVVATDGAITEIKDAETAHEDTRADADASTDANADADADADAGAGAGAGANAVVPLTRICATREWGALVCARPALPAETVVKPEAEDETDEEVHDCSVDGSSAPETVTLQTCAPNQRSCDPRTSSVSPTLSNFTVLDIVEEPACPSRQNDPAAVTPALTCTTAQALPPPPPLPPAGALQTLASHYSHDVCTTSMPNAAPSSSEAPLPPRTPPKPVPEEDEDEIASLFGNIEDDGDLCAIAQYRSLQEQRKAEPRQWARVQAQSQVRTQARSQLQRQTSSTFAAVDDNTDAHDDTDEFAYVHLRKTKPVVATIPPPVSGHEAGVNVNGCTDCEEKRSVYSPFNGIFHDNDDDDCEWVDVVAEVESSR